MSKRKTHEEFLDEIKDRTFTVLDKYANAKANLPFRCDIDGCEWSATPANILAGTGCPTCGNLRIGDANRRGNEIIEDNGNSLLIDISTPTHPDATMLCDKDIFEVHVSAGNGRIQANYGGYKYIHACYYSSHGSHNVFHRDVITTNIQVDHIKHGTMSFIDNRRCNLREATCSQNGMNQSVKKNNTSGVTGIRWNESSKKWVSRITINSNQKHLGYFADKLDAINARKQAEAEYFGDFSYSAHN